jgi:hypothetical protein
MRVSTEEKNAKELWKKSCGKFLRTMVTIQRKTWTNSKENEGAAVCKANDRTEGIVKETVISGQEKSRDHW